MKARLETIGDRCDFLVYRATAEHVERRTYIVEDVTADGAWSMLESLVGRPLEPADEATRLLLEHATD